MLRRGPRGRYWLVRAATRARWRKGGSGGPRAARGPDRQERERERRREREIKREKERERERGRKRERENWWAAFYSYCVGKFVRKSLRYFRFSSVLPTRALRPAQLSIHALIPVHYSEKILLWTTSQTIRNPWAGHQTATRTARPFSCLTTQTEKTHNKSIPNALNSKTIATNRSPQKKIAQCTLVLTFECQSHAKKSRRYIIRQISSLQCRILLRKPKIDFKMGTADDSPSFLFTKSAINK